MIRNRFFVILFGAWLGAAGLSPAPMAVAQGAKPAARTVEINEKGEPLAKGAAGAADATSGTLRLLRELEAFHKNVKTIHATFHQLRVDEVFREPVESEGKLWFDKPSSRFRADYANPDEMINLIVGNALYMYVKKLQQVDQYTYASAEERDQQLHELLIGFGFKADDLVRQYEIHSSADEPAVQSELEREKADLLKEKLDPDALWLFEIKPRAATAETSPFKQLKVAIDKTTHLPKKIWYKDQSDASMTLVMKSIELNTKLSDALFDKDKLFPPGTEFIDKRNAP